mmetsp:Transcript_5041/g.8230  ORF Transcript_5041/g.8230 Transcript_5041/m.8230 type:complete len:174 (-) Transcript_5041:75-596(-)
MQSIQQIRPEKKTTKSQCYTGKAWNNNNNTYNYYYYHKRMCIQSTTKTIFYDTGLSLSIAYEGFISSPRSFASFSMSFLRLRGAPGFGRLSISFRRGSVISRAYIRSPISSSSCSQSVISFCLTLRFRSLRNLIADRDIFLLRYSYALSIWEEIVPGSSHRPYSPYRFRSSIS